MRVLVHNYQYSEMGKIEIEGYNGGTGTSWVENFKLAILKDCALAPQNDAAKTTPVTVFLDPGTDLTLVRQEKLEDLETSGAVYAPMGRVFFGQQSWPAFALSFVFPKGETYSSIYGFIVPEKIDWDLDFGVADVWLGRDILNQLYVTFHGPDGTFTIVDPVRP